MQLHVKEYLYSKHIIPITLALLLSMNINAQIDDTGCVAGGFGVDAGLYSGVIEYGDGAPPGGTWDWFDGTSGLGIINEDNTAALTTLLQAGGNPIFLESMDYEKSSIVNGRILIDALFARDHFGGSGGIDITSFETASKNGEDPAIWDLGQANVLGKNDIIDVGAFMFREGSTLSDDLWLMGFVNRAEPGGSAYLDMEFYVEELIRNDNPQSGDAGEAYFDSGGPQLGHTAFQFNSSTGEITEIGDIIFNISLINGGSDPQVEMRLWVSRSDYDNITPANFSWGAEFDGAFNGTPFGYASIIPNSGAVACGYVNLAGETPAAPPWGTLNTSNNTYQTNYAEYSVFEFGLNMTEFGIDHTSLIGLDPCDFPISSLMTKTRASASFTAQLKDYAGPFNFGSPKYFILYVGNETISCLNPTVTLTATADRGDIDYNWITSDGNIVSDPPTTRTIEVNAPGTYTLEVTLPTTCTVVMDSITVGVDNSLPFFNPLTATTTVSCNGNDGTIDLNVSGATAPYSFNWSNGATVEDPTGLAPGSYTVTVTDSNGCTNESTSVTVAPENPSTINESIVDVLCFGDNTGSISLTVTGSDPFTYSWSNGYLTKDINGVSSGNYTITVTDDDGCTESETYQISEPSDINLSVSTVDDSDPDPLIGTGSIDLTVSGGTSPYSYDWDNNGPQDPDSDPQDISNLVAGVYEVTVTDANGCTAVIDAIIYEPEICDDAIDNDGDGLTDCYDPDCLPPNPGPITPSLDPVCVGYTNITYSITDVGADSYEWTVPAGAVITSGQGTNIIYVDWISNIGGNICVTAISNNCVSFGQSCYYVDVNNIPNQPGDIEIDNQN